MNTLVKNRTFLSEAALADFALRLRGDLIREGDADYDEVRQLYNGMIDKRPFLIARCTNVTDVITAVNFGRENNLLIAVRGGGHNGAGLGSCDDGLLIDLSQMKNVQVDSEQRTVRVQPGSTQGDMDQATHKYGLAVPAGIVASTGVAGLTLGGGHGYLSRKHGLTIDNLLEADVVLADGSFVTANKTQHSDLFWALRGGGGNFGIVTSFVFQAHPAHTIYGGPIFWDIAHTRQIMQWYRDFLPQAPEELSTFIGLKTMPSAAPFPEELWGKKVCALISCYNGPTEDAKAAMQPIYDNLPTPLLDGSAEMPYPAMQALFDPLLPKGLQWYWKGDFVKELHDEVIDVHLEFAHKFPSPQSLMHLYPIDGAVQRVGSGETAWNHRDATWSMVICGIDSDPGQAEALATWAKAYWQAVHPYTLGGAYINFMMEEGQERIKATYGDNYERLVSVKNRYDPQNVFRVNQNIKPTV
ncbi:MAG: FAD-binding oxidoreductase [Anaerolineaceae bacterium]|nr:FAD-binding oxidoreductase [Anaerolineaceae bacterium]